MVTQPVSSGREAPLYNIKAVARLTGVPADTLRRWESRYAVIAPQRTESGYRLYSQRDVDTILWLKARLAEGMSISRACDMLGQMGGDPGPAPAQPSPTQGEQASASRDQVRSFDLLQSELLAAFRAIDEVKAGEVVTAALSLYSIEDVCINVIQPALIEVGQGWLDGEISVAVEHFASSFMRARLENLFHSSPHNPYGPLVIVGCAPEEMHELGVMFLAVFLRRAGYRVIYLGQNVPIDSLMSMVEAVRPQVICISATRAETAASLYELRASLDALAEKQGHAPLLSYGGRVFNRYPHITERLGGLYLGEDARAAVRAIDDRIRREPRLQ
jgi:DNA-binding transcriptional MerR regulator